MIDFETIRRAYDFPPPPNPLETKLNLLKHKIQILEKMIYLMEEEERLADQELEALKLKLKL